MSFQPSTRSTFQSPSLDEIRGRQTAKVFQHVSDLNPHHPYGYILSDETLKIIEIVTWKQFLSDAKSLATILHASNPQSRVDVVVAVLGIHGYCYAVHWLAFLMNNWVVSMIMALICRNLLPFIIAFTAFTWNWTGWLPTSRSRKSGYSLIL